MALRDYQAKLDADIENAWCSGARNVLAVAPTGSGKTVLFSHVIKRKQTITAAIAHRAELVGQMSLTLARNGVRHRVMASKALIAEIEGMHMLKLGRRFVDPHSDVICAGVQTMVNRREPWMDRCGLWIVDEGQHLLKDNVWGKAVALLPNAIGLAVTAAAIRADGKGLGRHADGLIDVMVQGPGMRELIDRGYLVDYKIFAPPSDLDLSDVAIGASGDYVGEQVRKAVHRSHITGDIVQHYLRLARGKRGLTFTVDVDAAKEVAAAYRAAGVPAEALDGNSPTPWRARVMRALESGELLQVVNCDLLGEGTDVPAVEVVSFGRPTASLQLYRQQFGRVSRPLEGKQWGIVIDHVNNVRRHGLPDAPIEWTLDRRERRARSGPSDVVPVTTCTECSGVYERVLGACPYCNTVRMPARRDAPEYVDGELAELDAATLRAMWNEKKRVDGQLFGGHRPTNPVEAGMLKNHTLRQDAQRQLRETMALYGGWRKAAGDDVGMTQRRFYLTFGVDVMSAQVLGAREALELMQRIDSAVNSR